MLEKRLNNSNYHKKIKHTLKILGCAFVIFFGSLQSIVAQEIYIRVSENDCISCYGVFFSELIDSSNQEKFKFLFPKNYQGKRFEKFNQLYFQGKVTPERVVFSDSLYQLTQKPLNGLSGLAWIRNGKLLYAIQADQVAKKGLPIREYINGFPQAKQVIDVQEEGLSNRLNKAINYTTGNFILIDVLYRVVYLWNMNQQSDVMDFKDEAFQQILKRDLISEVYASHQKYRDRLQQMGKDYPEYMEAYLSDGKLFLSYMMPFIQLDSMTEEKGRQLGVRNLGYLSIVPITSKHITLKKVIENSYLDKNNYDDVGGYYTTSSMGVYNEEIYRINQLQYTIEDYKNHRIFPLFTTFKSNKKDKRIYFYHATDEIKNFAFQQDTLLNKEYLMEIGFLQEKENILLLNYPYAVNVAQKKKYPLDWDGSINKHYNPPKITYHQLQFWKKGDGFMVLIKNRGNYALKTYNQDWELQKEIPLAFNSEEIKDLRFSKDKVFLFTENELLTMPNVFE